MTRSIFPSADVDQSVPRGAAQAASRLITSNRGLAGSGLGDPPRAVMACAAKRLFGNEEFCHGVAEFGLAGHRDVGAGPGG